ncbi:MAG: cation:proton antiporter [Armatimonadota bacterium]
MVPALALALAWLCASPVLAAGAHESAVPSVLLGLVVVLAASRVGGHLATRVGQPPVLGELALGVLVGNAALLGYKGLEFIETDRGLDLLAEIGVVLLLFEVGLESRLEDMRRVGLSAALVAVVGVAGPFALGWVVSSLLMPKASGHVHMFIGAVLCATSVGITARVFQDLGRVDSPEARIILGAAVIDDVLGLIILAVAQGVVVAANGGGSISAVQVGLIVLKATGFLVGGVLIGAWLAPRIFRVANLLKAHGMLIAASLAFCFAFAYASAKAGLAPIVGAFAAGLILEEAHYRDLAEREQTDLHRLLQPTVSLLVPTFFVLMGARVDLRAFAHVSTIGLAAAITLAAVIGKQACSLAVLQRGVKKLAVGFGMVPRGEVGLIFAAVGMRLTLNGQPVISSGTFSAIVIMVLVTTFAAPPLLKWALASGERYTPQAPRS